MNLKIIAVKKPDVGILAASPAGRIDCFAITDSSRSFNFTGSLISAA
jgi:hypothetical protein